jgi:mono/diheme cytochrome c family protein
MTKRRRALAAASILAIGLAATACGSEGISSKVSSDKPNIAHGADLFAERCAGCHTMDLVGAQGGATLIKDRERVDGPNFNVRKETTDSVLYAIRNGGFSGAIMPENIVVGNDANDVAAFLAKYAGSQRKPEVTPAQPAGGGGANAGPTTTPQTTSTPQNTTSTGGGTQQANAQAKQAFTQNCAACHTLKDAGATGNVGPNLDDLKPDAPTVQRQVTNGGGGMPAFKGTLTPAQIQAVAQYVSSVAGK